MGSRLRTKYWPDISSIPTLSFTGGRGSRSPKYGLNVRLSRLWEALVSKCSNGRSKTYTGSDDVGLCIELYVTHSFSNFTDSQNVRNLALILDSTGHSSKWSDIYKIIQTQGAPAMVLCPVQFGVVGSIHLRETSSHSGSQLKILTFTMLFSQPTHYCPRQKFIRGWVL